MSAMSYKSMKMFSQELINPSQCPAHYPLLMSPPPPPPLASHEQHPSVGDKHPILIDTDITLISCPQHKTKLRIYFSASERGESFYKKAIRSEIFNFEKIFLFQCEIVSIMREYFQCVMFTIWNIMNKKELRTEQ